VIGSSRIAWHSIFSFLGMLCGSFVSIRCARYLVRDERIYPFAIAVVIGGLVGARIAHVTDNWSLYQNDPVRALQFWSGGIGTMGAPIGASIAGYLAARWLRLPMGFMFDISVIGIALGEAVGRIGDIINATSSTASTTRSRAWGCRGASATRIRTPSVRARRSTRAASMTAY
jgi:phosphatidylglycerol---prolipoprotein diacylglyceryl transferase